MTTAYADIFRRHTIPPAFPNHMSVLAWVVACQYSYTPEFAAQLERDLMSAPRLTVEQRRVRWERWQSEQREGG